MQQIFDILMAVSTGAMIILIICFIGLFLSLIYFYVFQKGVELEAENERLRKIEWAAGKIYRAGMQPSLIRSNRDPRNCFPTWWFDLCLGWLGEALGDREESSVASRNYAEE